MKNKLTQWLILLVLVLTWGSSFILMKKGLLVFPPLQMGALRIVLTFLFLLPFMVLRIRKIKRRQWGLFFLSGLLGSGIPAMLFAYAQSGIDSSLSGILNSLTPLFTLLVGLLFFRFRARWFQITGVFIGLAGACGLVALSGGGDISWNFSYASFIILATILYAININIVKTYFTETDPISITTYTIGAIGLPALLYLLGCTNFITLMQETEGAWRAFSMIAILSVAGTGVAGILYNYLIKISNVIFASSVTYMIPIVAVFWGLGDGEHFSAYSIIWILLVMAGVFLVNNPLAKKNK